LSWWHGAGSLCAVATAGNNNAAFRNARLTNMNPTTAMERGRSTLENHASLAGGKQIVSLNRALSQCSLVSGSTIGVRKTEPPERSLFHLLDVLCQVFDLLGS